MAARASSQSRTAELETIAGRFAIQIATEYLGSAGPKTVVRVRLSSPELSSAASKRGLQSFSGELEGRFVQGSTPVEEFRYPVSGELSEAEPFTYSFLRAVPPGSYELRLRLLAPGGREVGVGSVEVAVPELGNVFRPEMAPGEASTLPSAEAIVIADEADEKLSLDRSVPKLKILPPSRETPVGLLRLEAEVLPPVEKVEFYLEDRLLLRRTKPPYTVEIDLGEIPRRQTVRAVGYDGTGRVVDEDAWAINQGSARVAVRVLPRTDPAAGIVRIKVAVQSIGGGMAKHVDLFLDEKKLGSWTAPPFEVTIPLPRYAAGTYLRATAISVDGQEATDIRMIKGPAASVESVRVDVVQLHVSALDKEGRFVKGLPRDAFAVREDGRSQNLTGFEVAENLPLTVGLVVDGSGSMEKSLSFVHAASSALFQNLMRKNDRGFVIEFRERPKFLQDLTDDSGALQRAARQTKAEGATALYDSVILGLYQFRTLQGRRALVVVTDGADNRSHVEYDTLLRYARSAGAPIYFVAVGIPLTDFKSRRVIKEMATESGGDVFHVGNAEKMQEVTRRIEEELRSQYILAFRTDSKKPPGEYRAVEVDVRRAGITARTVRGYIP